MYREGRRDRAQQNQSIVVFPWQDLQGDLKLEILSRLPTKSLLRFKCVCKHWLSLFSEPSFIHKHLLHLASTTCDDNDSTLLVHGDADKCVYSTFLLKLKDPPNPVTFNLNRQFPDEINLSDMSLVGSINGLVCLSSGRQTGGSMLILWNPATKQYTNIPTPNINLPSQGGLFTIGFCFDSLRNDYKIVRLVWSEPLWSHPCPRTEVYFVSEECWREIEVELPFSSKYPQCDTIVRGEPYWSAHSLSSKPFGFVVWFDACEEVFRTGPSLALGWPRTTVKVLVNFENSVAVLASTIVSSSQGTPSFFINGRLSQGILMVGLWVMEDESCQWSLKFNAEFSRPIGLVGCSKKGDIVFSTHHVDVLQLYNPRTQETSNTRIRLEVLGYRRFRFRVSDYTASLVPVRKSKQAEKEGIASGSNS